MPKNPKKDKMDKVANGISSVLFIILLNVGIWVIDLAPFWGIAALIAALIFMGFLVLRCTSKYIDWIYD